MPTQTPDKAIDGPSLAEFVRARRVELDMTQNEAAQRAGVSRRTWAEIERGTRTSSTELTLSQIDQALQIPEGTLFRMTAQSLLNRAEKLRRQAHEMVRSMGIEELEYFVSHRGVGTVAEALVELRQGQVQLLKDLAELTKGPSDDDRRPRRATARRRGKKDDPGDHPDSE